MSHIVWEKAEDGLGRSLAGESKAWLGDVFFDHLRGIIDPDPIPLIDNEPFILVCHSQDFDWTLQNSTEVIPYREANALIAEARARVEQEKSLSNSNFELWEVYGVRVHRRVPASSSEWETRG
jgi:hypothetical protein